MAAPASKRAKKLGTRVLHTLHAPHGVLCVSAGSLVDFGVGKDPDRVALVNAANSGGLDGGGIDGALNNAGAPNLRADREMIPSLLAEEESQPGAPQQRIATGGAAVTGAPGRVYGELHASYVIHAVGPDFRRTELGLGTLQQRQQKMLLLGDAYLSAMGLAKALGIKSLAFAPLSAGVFRGEQPLVEILEVGMEAAVAHTYPGLEEVHFIAYSEEESKAMLAVLGQLGERVSGYGIPRAPAVEEAQARQQRLRTHHVGILARKPQQGQAVWPPSPHSSDYAAPGEGTCWEGMTRSTQTDEVSQLHALLARLARRDPPHWVEWERRLAALSDPNVWNAAAVARATLGCKLSIPPTAQLISKSGPSL